MNSKFPNEFLSSKLSTLEVFTEGRFSFHKQEQKLFKFLYKYSFITQYEIDKINSLRGSSSYLMISRNPIDMMFCSTDQSFTSCMDYFSANSSNYCCSLPGLVIDPNKILIALVNEKPKIRALRGFQFTHFQYDIRSFCILTKSDFFVVLRYYPSSKVIFSSLLSNFMNIIELRDFDSFASKNIN
jgi:hypothetical protein